MRLSTLPFLLLIFLAGCTGQDSLQPATTGLVPSKHFDPVSTLADLPTSYEPVQSGAALSGRLKTEYNAGQLSSEWRYHPNGQLAEFRMYRNGEVQTATQYRYTADNRLRYVQTFTNDCMYRSTSTCSGPVRWNTYDEIETTGEGKISSRKTYLLQNNLWELRSVTDYVYDNRQRLSAAKIYDGSKQLSSTQELTYDSNNNITAIKETRPNAAAGQTVQVLNYQYAAVKNPYTGLSHYISAFFLSPYLQESAPPATYKLNAGAYPTQIRTDNTNTTLEYY
ncbi:hypothetical protein [Arsenicibacter rosenii]|uniref:DUF4595 domain-containing protein n=1 Tax=Arsenicibacter rosenii TaxID=1750698 RepID=A0A1S2VMY7_9BACT|nr:hypothetical protein [Arsenicibacter rosenii]OIN59760.1 hypothetical protein BLX24_07845 [Arsenicibacter rosenii]